MTKDSNGNNTALREIIIDERYVGPPNITQGGYISGFMAMHLDSGCVAVTMRNPTPMGKPLTLDTSAPDLVLLHDGDKLLNEARPAKLDMEIPEPISFEEAQKASLRHVTEMPYPNCFGCGSGRSEADGLHMRSGPVKGRNLVAIDWTPRAAAVGAEEGEDIPLPIIWSAMECPVGRALDLEGMKTPEELILLGRMTTKVITRPKAGQECFIMGWPIERAGRRMEIAGTMHTKTGDVMVMSRLTFIILKQGVTYDSFA